MEIRARYDTPDENGVTRRARNEAFDADAPPPVIVPSAGQYLWDWYLDLAQGVSRVRSGVCTPIPFADYLAWARVAGLIVRPPEYAILRAVDRVFCRVINEELKAYRDRQRDKQQQEIEASKSKRGRR